MVLRLLITFALLVVSVHGQAVQEKPVLDLSGGLVSGLKNALMAENQETQLENYDIVLGKLQRRKGMSIIYTDAASGRRTEGLIPYFGSAGDRQLLLLRSQTTGFPNDTADANVLLLTKCDPTTAVCTTTVYKGFHSGRRDLDIPYNLNFTTWNNDLLITDSRSEAVIYNGDWIHPVRPYGPGQLRAVGLDGGGHVNGTVRYKYAWIDTSGADTSNFSAPSWPIRVDSGKVYVWGFATAPFDTILVNGGWVAAEPVGSILVYRSIDDGDYLLLDSAAYSDTLTILDTTGTLSPGDTTTYKWGPHPRLTQVNVDWTGLTESNVVAPGGFTVGVSVNGSWSANAPGIGPYGYADNNDTIVCLVGYSVVFVDTAGRPSMPSPAVWATLDTNFAGSDTVDSKFKAHLGEIPVPSDSGIVHKLLLRCIALTNYEQFPCPAPWSCSWDTTWLELGGIANSQYNEWFSITTLDDSVTDHWDSLSIKAYHDTVNSLYSSYRIDSTADSIMIGLLYWETYSQVGEQPESTYASDSVISFQPVASTIHGARTFAIGSQDNPRRVYYSEFGSLSNWPYDKTLLIGSNSGDWPVSLLSLDERLVVFSQNSVWQISGLSFSNFQIGQLTSNVGLTAPRSVGLGLNEIYFAHQTGVYKFGRFEGIGKYPVSLMIKSVIDSIGSNLKEAFGAMVGEEYWFSAPINDTLSKTYIYSEVPQPHWKEYSFGVRDAIQFDRSAKAGQFGSNRWVLLRENDSLYEFGAGDTLDGAAAYVATYQSKAFFDNGNQREKIEYIDLQATGECDSLQVTVYDNYGEDSVFSAVLSTDFTDNDRDRIAVNKIVRNCTVKINDFGSGDYQLQGYVIGFIPWDNGRK